MKRSVEKTRQARTGDDCGNGSNNVCGPNNKEREVSKAQQRLNR